MSLLVCLPDASVSVSVSRSILLLFCLLVFLQTFACVVSKLLSVSPFPLPPPRPPLPSPNLRSTPRLPSCLSTPSKMSYHLVFSAYHKPAHAASAVPHYLLGLAIRTIVGFISCYWLTDGQGRKLPCLSVLPVLLLCCPALVTLRNFLPNA